MNGPPSPLRWVRRVVLEPDTVDSDLAQRLRSWADRVGVEVSVDRGQGRAHGAPDASVEPSKGTLRVARHRGALVKPCTGRTDALLCCNLHVVTQTVGCPLNCTYCVLQDYQNRSQIVLCADPEPMLDRLVAELAEQPRRLWRVCTGQVADSLALEPLAGFSEPAVRRFAALDNAILELKTKTDNVEPLLGLPHNGRTVVSWTLNPDEVARDEELRCAPLSRRMDAAARVAADGYMVAFHLDPMLPPDPQHPHAEAHVRLVDRTLDAVPAHRVAYISMGTTRYLPAMRRTLARRFPHSRALLGEMVPDIDGKVRLLAPVRVRLYRRVAEAVRRRCPDAFLYLCMERADIWQRALGQTFAHRDEVDLAFARSLHRRFGLAPREPDPADYQEEGQ